MTKKGLEGALIYFSNTFWSSWSLLDNPLCHEIGIREGKSYAHSERHYSIIGSLRASLWTYEPM